jgi:hypothetical protein
MKTSATVADRLLLLAQRAVDRIAQSQCQPDEYAQLAPLLEEEFERRRSRQRRARRIVPVCGDRP